MMLDSQYWNKRYADQTHQWDIGAISKPLQTYFDQLTNLDTDMRILIPGCGSGYEADYLLQKGFKNIVILDFSKTITNQLKQKYHDNKQIKILCGDFFKHEGTYDMVVEQTFFCAIDPALRLHYVLKMTELLAKKGRLVGVLFNRTFAVNPPFGGNKLEYIDLFEPYFTLKTIDECHNSIPQRQGSELFINFIKK